MLQRPPTLSDVPLWTLGHACPMPTNLRTLFKNWPADKLNLLVTAQQKRDAIEEIILKDAYSVAQKLERVNEYLPYALAMEKEMKGNQSITANKENRFKWKQTPLVTSKYLDRSFNADFIQNEVLHVIWLRGVLLLNNAYVQYKADQLEASVQSLRESAGVFLYLANDRLRVTTEPVAIEFQAPVFNSFSSVALAEAYSLIAAKAEADGLAPAAIGKLCYAISTTYNNAFDAIKAATPEKAIHEQYCNWVNGIQKYFFALAAINMGYSQASAQKDGQAIGLYKLAISRLDGIDKLDKHNVRLNQASVNILGAIKPVESKLAKDNAAIKAEYVPPANESEQFITASCTTLPNLPTAIPFQPPTL